MRENEIKRLYQNAFWGAFAAIVVAEMLVGIILMLLLSKWMGGGTGSGLFGGISGGLWLVNLVGANWIATARCRRLGVSKDSRTVETIKHIVQPTQALNAQQPIEIRCPKSKAGRIACPIFFALVSICYLCWLLYAPQSFGNKILGIVGLVFFVPCTFLAVLTVNVPEARADEHGISGYHGLLRRSIRWGQVAACDIVTTRNVFGQIASIYPIFKDVNGKVLMTLNPLVFFGVPMDERDRLIDFIKVRLQGTLN